MENSKILAKIKKINLLIIIDLILIVMALCLIQYTNIDIEIQNHFFDFTTKTWLIDRDEPIKKLIFYKFPKIIFGVGILFCLIAAIIGFKKKSEFFFKNRHKFFLIFLGLSLIPLIAGNVKKFTNIYCPTSLEIYGEDLPYVRIFDDYPPNFIQQKRGQCFPAGHAVTGFALMILFFAFETPLYNAIGLTSGLVLGWVMAGYQMLKGVHFFGDSLVAMLLCFLIAAAIARLYYYKLAKRSN